MSQDAGSFFRGISARISAARQSYGAGRMWRKKEKDEKPRQPVAPSSSSSSRQPFGLCSAECALERSGGGGGMKTVTSGGNNNNNNNNNNNGSSNNGNMAAVGDALVPTGISNSGCTSNNNTSMHNNKKGGGEIICMHNEQITGVLLTQVQQVPNPSNTSSSSAATAAFSCVEEVNWSSLVHNINKHNNNNDNNNNNNISSSSNTSSSNNNRTPPCMHPPPHPSPNTAAGDARNTTTTITPTAVEVRPKIHISALLARTRKISEMPTNTSPIIAKNHPSLLPPQLPKYNGKKTLILDLDETLVHSSLTQQPKQHDFVLQIRADSGITPVYVSLRPFLQEFIQKISPFFEIVIFTASVSIYCNPVMDTIDAAGLLGPLRLCREHCSMLHGAYVKDLSLLGRDLSQIAIIDNSPVAYLFQQRNAIPITSWFDDPNDCELKRLIPVLEALRDAGNVYDVLDQYNAVLQLQQEQARIENE